jgi:hypothetical protein
MAVTRGGVGRFWDRFDADLRMLALMHNAGLHTLPLKIALPERVSDDAINIESFESFAAEQRSLISRWVLLRPHTKLGEI